MLLSTVITFIFLSLALYAGLFALWRIFEKEHIEETTVFLDKMVLSALVAIFISHLPGSFFALGHEPLSLGLFLNLLHGSFSWQVGYPVFALTLFLLLRDTWKDKFIVLDLGAISLSVFLGFVFLSRLVTTIVLGMVAPAQFSLLFLIITIISMCAFFGVSKLLVHIERQYRTYFWYRYRRSSAQSGFVSAVFLIAFGLIGISDALGSFPFEIISLPMFMVIWSIFTTVSGFILIYVRSGRLKGK
ncbi:MAG: hypothetical protein ABI758_06490 [Candidatus Woesebacteria bacterium]